MNEAINHISQALRYLNENKYNNIRNYLYNAKRELERIGGEKPVADTTAKENFDRKVKEASLGVLQPIAALKIIDQLIGEEKKKIEEIYKRKQQFETDNDDVLND